MLTKSGINGINNLLASKLGVFALNHVHRNSNSVDIKVVVACWKTRIGIGCELTNVLIHSLNYSWIRQSANACFIAMVVNGGSNGKGA